MNNETLKPICSQLEKIELGAGYTDKIEGARKEAVKTLTNAPAIKHLAKAAGNGGAELVADCLTLLRTIKGMQKLVEQKCGPEWKDPQLGQARMHAYVDLWGRTESLLALLEDLLSEAADTKASQLAAGLEALTDGIKQNFSETSQILLMNGEVTLVTPIVTWALARFDGPSFKQLSGSILKELHSL